MQPAFIQSFGPWFSRNSKRVLLSGILMFFAVLWLQHLLRKPAPFDDAYMFLRYARNLIDHGLIGWNPDEVSYGCTSLGYALGTTLSLLLGLEGLLGGARLLVVQSYLWGIAALYMLYVSLRSVLKHPQLQQFQLAKAAVVLVLISPAFYQNILSGMDTGMALFANSCLLYYTLRHAGQAGRKQVVIILLLAYFSYFVRPDNGLLALLFPGMLLWLRDQRQQAIRFTTLFALVLSLDAIAKYAYFGYPIPLPAYVKSWDYYNPYLEVAAWNYFSYLRAIAVALSPVVVMLFLVVRPAFLRDTAPFFFPVLLTYLYFGTTFQIMGWAGRFYVPAFPFLLAGSLLLLNRAWPIQLTATNLVSALIAPALLILFFQIFGTKYFSYLEQRAQQQAAPYQANMPVSPDFPILDWDQSMYHLNGLLAQFPAQTSIAASEHGYLGYRYRNMNIMCLAGLHNNRFADRSLSREAILETSLRDAQPELIWLLPYAYVKLNHDLIHSDYFQQHYDYYPGAISHGLAIHKSSPRRHLIGPFLQASYALDSPPKPLKPEVVGDSLTPRSTVVHQHISPTDP